MKKEKIDFNVALKNAFGEEIKETKVTNKAGSKEKEEKEIPLCASHVVVNILSNPSALPEECKMDAVAIIKRLALQQKVASKEPQIYSTEELGIIQDAMITLYNKKIISVEIAGEILKMTN